MEINENQLKSMKINEAPPGPPRVALDPLGPSGVARGSPRVGGLRAAPIDSQKNGSARGPNPKEPAGYPGFLVTKRTRSRTHEADEFTCGATTHCGCLLQMRRRLTAAPGAPVEAARSACATGAVVLPGATAQADSCEGRAAIAAASRALTRARIATNHGGSRRPAVAIGGGGASTLDAGRWGGIASTVADFRARWTASSKPLGSCAPGSGTVTWSRSNGPRANSSIIFLRSS